MSETPEVETPSEGEGAQQAPAGPDLGPLLEGMEALGKKVDELGKKAATPPQPPSQPPRRGAQTRDEERESLMKYAADKGMEAERLKLAIEFGLAPEQLEGEYTSPTDMRRKAELLALQKQTQALEERLLKVGSSGEVPPTPPEIDTGGASSIESPEGQELQEQYDKARSLGRTTAGRQALLDALYKDPGKRSLKSPTVEI